MEAPEPGKCSRKKWRFFNFRICRVDLVLVEPDGVRLCLQRALEAFTIILAGTQLLCVGLLHAGANAAIVGTPMGARARV
jgi:hypothetical protein